MNLSKTLRIPLVLALSSGAFAFSGCATHDIHPQLKADPDILMRQWTLRTRKEFKPGNRMIDFSNARLHENTLLFGNQSAGLVSLYPSLLQIRWVLPFKNGVMSDIEVKDGAAYLVAGDGHLYSVDTETGRVNWRYDVHTTMASRPTIAEGKVFVTTADDVVYAFEAKSGKWLWHFRRRSGSTATVKGASAPLVDKGEVLAGLSDGFLVSLNVSDGQLKWEKRLHEQSKFMDVDAKPILENGVIYIPSYDGALYALRRKDGDAIWRFDSGGGRQAVLDGSRIYLPSSDGHVYALDKSTGKQIWRFELDRGVPTDVAVTRNHIIFGSSHQYLYAVEKANGKGEYRYNAGSGSGFYGAPVYDPRRERLYILSGFGNLYSFSLYGHALDQEQLARREKLLPARPESERF